jgi:uncharacterized protein YcfJ
MKSFDPRLVGIVAVALMLTACVGQMAPTVAVMPGPNKPFDAFSADQSLCRQYADAQIAPLRDQANASTVGSTLVGAALGAGIGAAVGGGRGAAIGAASGAAVGMSLQQQYDVLYSQCMYGRGNQVPGYYPGQYGLPSYRPY